MNKEGDNSLGHIINYATIEKFLWDEMRVQALLMRGNTGTDRDWNAAYRYVHRKFVLFLKIAQRRGRKTEAKTEEGPCAPYYTGFFITVINSAYANGDTHVQLTPEHVAVLKDMLKDYGMLECRRARKDPDCRQVRRACDYAAKFDECTCLEDSA
jgi:hypothetical protein